MYCLFVNVYCTVLLPPGDNPIAVNKYIISHRIISGTQLCKQINRRLLMALGIEDVDDWPSDSISIKDEEMGRECRANGN